MQSFEGHNKMISEELSPVTDIDIRALAEIYDEQDVYLSVYLPVSGRENEHLNRIFVDSRFSAIKKALDPDLRSEFEKTFEMAESSVFDEPISGEKGRIIFASSKESFLHVYRLAVEPEQSFVLDTSPYLLPLAKLRADYEDYGVLLVDSREARFTCIRSDIAEEKKHLSTDLMNKHKKGGWSQMRFNHLRKGAIKSFLSEVADNVQGTCDQLQTRGFVLAGPGEAKQHLMEILPQEVQQKVLGVVDVPIDIPEDELVEAGDAVLQENEKSKSRSAAEELKSEILKGGLAVYGIEDVKASLEQARVNTLLIIKDSSVPGWLCERCQNLQSNSKPPKECERCGGPTSTVDVVEELYELAQRTGANVEFVEKEDFLDSDDVVGALLRY
ncbi:Vms1/Ankzf1 family peptidyl-tRNA hydrolase [Methanolobus bombayensis]|uniref:baeRF10 domain-containing protein n=1 Tax=Methanolobus bombayensis TaxID=38023 RepID=UPI001AE4BE4F|nr:Vms1/Ankzf1 family peptidyl-tRNA hydrolase [Methanolobus bombayensis]MBP1909547.1 peptide chain release factor subunit 1 [Methanolobus bombayensis]